MVLRPVIDRLKARTDILCSRASRASELSEPARLLLLGELLLQFAFARLLLLLKYLVLLLDSLKFFVIRSVLQSILFVVVLLGLAQGGRRVQAPSSRYLHLACDTCI